LVLLSLFAPLSCFLLAIVLSVLHRFVDSAYTFGIFKLVLTGDKLPNQLSLNRVIYCNFILIREYQCTQIKEKLQQKNNV